MDYDDSDGDGSDGFDWNATAGCSSAGGFQFSKQDLDLDPDCFGWGNTGEGFGSGEASSSSGPSSQLISKFVVMGFPREMVLRAIDINGENNSEAILETLLTFQNIEKFPSQSEPLASEQERAISDLSSSESVGNFLDDFSDEDDFGNEEHNGMTENGIDTIQQLVAMGYSHADASIAMERCGSGAFVADLIDFIGAAQMATLLDEPQQNAFHRQKLKKKKKPCVDDDRRQVIIPNPMIGFGVPGRPCVRFRSIPAEAIGPPYFYYENVSSALKDDWPTISSFLFDIQPEFVDSMFFSAAARKRGYVHNLPVTDRFQLQPIPPQTIVEALPMTRPWWPSWDPRTKFNCLVTRKGSSQFTEKIRKALEDSNNEPSPELVTYIKQTCRRWNLVWVAKNTAVPLEANEIEALLGYPKNHTRGGGIGSSERFERLGNSFQVDTIGYHLSVLKKMYPNGMNVLSLFSGIGGAEVALDRLGIRLKNVVSVEVLESCQKILRNWWESTYQTGNLIEIGDVQELDNAKLESLVNDVGGFDLIIGGSPCNNLSGNNRKSRVGLDGDKSCLFFDYVRVLKQVKTIMAGRIQG